MDLENYIQISGPLFKAVQKSTLFPDSKTFVDSYPRIHPKDVLKAYQQEKNHSGFDLKQFVLKYFVFPEEQKKTAPLSHSMTDYIHKMWNILKKDMVSPSPYSTLIPLPKPHIVPGGRFQECFYWDSYFTALGLAISKKINIIKDMVENFAYLIDHLGFIPNGNRIYFASRSQPPYFSYLLNLLLNHLQEKWVLRFMPQLEAEYAFWMHGAEKLTLNNTATHHVVRIDETTVLNRYYDDLDIPRPEAYQREITLAKNEHPNEFFRHLRAACASGWDFSSRWLENPKYFQTIWALDLIPVDLNCLMYHLEYTLSDFAKRLKDSEKEKHYATLAKKRKKAIEKIFWNEEKKFYFDYHFHKKTHTNTWSLAGTSPLFNRVATQAQAEIVGKHLKEKFLFPGGLITSLYEGIHQWDKPNGWAPLQWIAIQGLLNYGNDQLAKEIASRWLKLNQKIYLETGKMLEKYNVCDCSAFVARGEYKLQEGFGWTNGVALGLIDLFEFKEY